MERNKLVTERNKLVMERNKLVTERRDLAAQRNKLVMKRDKLVMERDKLVASRDETDATRIRTARLRVLSDRGAGACGAAVLPGVAGRNPTGRWENESAGRWANPARALLPFSGSPMGRFRFFVKSVYSVADASCVAADGADESDSTGRENFHPKEDGGGSSPLHLRSCSHFSSASGRRM
jgi:hypothetical protein